MNNIRQGEYAGRSFERLKQLRVLTWNIERGLRLPEVMDFVRRQEPDVCIFQEVDLNARRTEKRDVADFIAKQFGFNYVFGVEFEELSQGSKDDPAFQGQAVFARSKIASPRILRFRRQSDIWRWSSIADSASCAGRALPGHVLHIGYHSVAGVFRRNFEEG
jgi:hypothetical protein